MNMTAINFDQQTPIDTVIQQEIHAISALNDSHQRHILDYSKGFLDKVFPLAVGSHKDVCSYVVYYQHLLAFFADGSNSGLENPSQFVALAGSREKPQGLLFNDNGRHVALMICRSGLQGAKDQAGIDDVQLELQDEQGRHWFSMIQGQLQPSLGRRKPRFTAKEGGDYHLA